MMRRSDLARPALVKAREQADESQRWWIDAPLQEMERKTGAGKATEKRP